MARRSCWLLAIAAAAAAAAAVAQAAAEAEGGNRLRHGRSRAHLLRRTAPGDAEFLALLGAVGRLPAADVDVDGGGGTRDAGIPLADPTAAEPLRGVPPPTSTLFGGGYLPYHDGAPNLENKFRAPQPDAGDADASDDVDLLDGGGDADEAGFPVAEGTDGTEPADDETGRPVSGAKEDIVTRFLRIVESQQQLGVNCTAGTDLNLGEGVVDRYAQERFRVEADVAVNRANMLTRLWKYAAPAVTASEYLLHASVFSMVEFDDDIFAAGNCYDAYQYKDYWLYCPYAYRLPEGPILVKDLAVEYKYLSNTSEWFYIARKNAENVIHNHNQFSRGAPE